MSLPSLLFSLTLSLFFLFKLKLPTPARSLELRHF